MFAMGAPAHGSGQIESPAPDGVVTTVASSGRMTRSRAVRQTSTLLALDEIDLEEIALS